MLRTLLNDGLQLLLIGVLLSVGCAAREKSEPTYPVSGKVVMDGEPVKEGEILFYSTDNAMSPDVGEIKDGAFQFAAKAGPARVEIRASKPTGKMLGPPPGETGASTPEMKSYIPAAYNSDTKLTATVTQNAAENQFEFNLTKDGK